MLRSSAFDLRRTAQHLLLDRQTVDVITALRSAGIDALLLKGPALAHRLYNEAPQTRWYCDSDVMVPPQRRRDAQGVLRAIGYRRSDVDPDFVVHATTWARPELPGVAVDLHHALVGGVSDAAVAWASVWNERDELTLCSSRVPVMGPVGTALLLALHVDRHGTRLEKPDEDLRRGLERLPHEVWASAFDLARAARLTEPFARGLRRQAPALADALGAPAPPATREGLVRETGVPGSAALALIVRSGGTTQRTRAVLRRLVPPAAYMRQVEQAAPGLGGLLSAYGRRWCRLFDQAPAALRAWWRTGAPRSDRA